MEKQVRNGVIERYGRLSELDRSFDREFWQRQTARARFDATWELIVHACRVKDKNVREPRLQRSVETFQRRKG